LAAENEIVPKFTTTLKQLMNERSVSASLVSQATGIPKSSLSEWLSGRKPMLDDSIVKLARFFGVSVERLITGAEPEVSLLKDVLEQADENFVSLHSGVYRLKIERYVGTNKGKK
jgi:transcriptional regulator with XRE-family HTH domain